MGSGLHRLNRLFFGIGFRVMGFGVYYTCTIITRSPKIVLVFYLGHYVRLLKQPTEAPKHTHPTQLV